LRKNGRKKILEHEDKWLKKQKNFFPRWLQSYWRTRKRERHLRLEPFGA
jgi:hypothetical protein